MGDTFKYFLPNNAFYDPDLDVDTNEYLTYSFYANDLSEDLSWISINTNTGSIEGTPTNSNVGLLDLKIRATDQSGFFAEQDVSLQINRPIVKKIYSS